jgi:Bifunctional DNA primase/polymerase, N-terminal
VKASITPDSRREKKPYPILTQWQTFTFDDTQTDEYQKVLRLAPNTGVLLGTPSGNLCTVDADDDQYLAEFLELNPALASFVTKGSRGGQAWMYVLGEYPHGVKNLKAKDGNNWGEFRSDGGQSVIRGIHPNGNPYAWISSDPPPKIQFSDIRWPDTLILPWQEQAKAKAVEKESGPAIATQRIDACKLKEKLLQVLPEYAEMLVPDGRRVGDRWVAGSIDGGEGKSFSINLATGVCGDFAEDARMYDPIGLWMRVHGVDFLTALREIRTWLDNGDWSDSPRHRRKPKNEGHNRKARQAIATSGSIASPASNTPDPSSETGLPNTTPYDHTRPSITSHLLNTTSHSYALLKPLD